MEKIPTGRTIGTIALYDDVMIVGALTGTIAIVIDESYNGEGYVPSYAWLQEVNKLGVVIAEPHMGPPIRMPAHRALDMFTFD